jgi:hypothetical protein
MKGHKAEHHKGRHHKALGGPESGDAKEGTREYEQDLKDNPEKRNNAPKITGAAEEKKHGGRAKRKRGGHVHHETHEHMKHAEHLGKVKGTEAHQHSGRRPRKAGGKACADSHPLSSAHAGTLPPHHKDADID